MLTTSTTFPHKESLENVQDVGWAHLIMTGAARHAATLPTLVRAALCHAETTPSSTVATATATRAVAIIDLIPSAPNAIATIRYCIIVVCLGRRPTP